MTLHQPTLDEVRQLVASHRLTVPERFGDDVTGHVNVRHRLALNDDAVRRHFAALGCDERFIEARRRNFFDLETTSATSARWSWATR